MLTLEFVIEKDRTCVSLKCSLHSEHWNYAWGTDVEFQDSTTFVANEKVVN